jgi:hypothetical protein
MCLPKEFKFSENIECGKGGKSGKSGVTSIYIITKADFKWVDGVMVKKRKYGKLKRDIVKLVKP